MSRAQRKSNATRLWASEDRLWADLQIAVGKKLGAPKPMLVTRLRDPAHEGVGACGL